MRTHTVFLDFSRLAACGEHGVVVARMALVCNDVALANSAMSHFNKSDSTALHHIRQGARLYFVRMQCGHLYEGLETLRQVRDTPELACLVRKCYESAQEAFRELCDCLPGQPEHKKFKQNVGWIRNRVAFHYDRKDVKWAIGDRANPSTPSSRNGSMTAGEDIHTTRFEFGDALLDSVVCRRLWKIPTNVNFQAEADLIGEWCFTKCVAYLEFAGAFVPVFLREREVVL